jgi:hypothetical protein
MVLSPSSNITIYHDVVTELILIQLFRSFPGRTWNLTEADIVVVPSPQTQCCNLYYIRTLDREKQLKFCTELHSNLGFWNISSQLKQRHVFIQAGGRGLVDEGVSKGAIELTYGPSWQQGAFVIPIYADGISLSMVQSRVADEEWWTRTRPMAFSYYFGGMNPKMRRNQPRQFRKYFARDMLRYNQSTLGGLPYRISEIDAKQNNTFNRTYGLRAYTESVFCPVLPGDTTWQGRFFDAVLNGCIPVVLAWNSTTALGTTHFPPFNYETSVQQSYPFANQKAVGYDPALEIDYTSFVVECRANKYRNRQYVSMLRETMNDLLLNRPDEIRQRQLAMRNVALSLTYGIGKEAHRHEDAFAKIIRTLRRHVDTLDQLPK